MVVTDRDPTLMARDDVMSAHRHGSPSARLVADPEAADLRVAGTCPICEGSSTVLDLFDFAAKPDLPDVARFEVCVRCNFLFATDVSAEAYRRYYASAPNDRDHVIDDAGSDSQVRLQLDRIATLLAPGFDGRVLDVGCGRGRLLNAIGQRFPSATMFGHDVVDFLSPAATRIRFVPTLADLDERFDLIVLSHVLEHLVGFEILRSLEGLLAPGGRLYVEVPDPLGYARCPRREFMYYFDRLHINQFGSTAMRRLLARFGLESIDRGTHRFRYRDGPYPARYEVAARAVDHVDEGGMRARLREGELADSALDVAYRQYREQEAVRAGTTKRVLEAAAGGDGILVYGAGDNFSRARWPEGPLHGLALLAIMDRRAAEMPCSPGVSIEFPEVALSRFPTAPVAITISQRPEEIANAIRAAWPTRSIFFV